MRLITVTVLALLTSVVGAEPQTSPPRCDAPEYHEFDFWLGAWDVVNPAGEQVGTNVITSELAGCALHEHWESTRSPHRGNSYNIYDRASGRWHQTWIDNTGLLLQLDGGLREGTMVLEGRTRRPDGTAQLERISWTPQAEGVVRQIWEQSSDGGRTWAVAFHGRYRRRP